MSQPIEYPESTGLSFLKKCPNCGGDLIQNKFDPGRLLVRVIDAEGTVSLRSHTNPVDCESQEFWTDGGD